MNSILIKIVEVSILLTTILFAITRFTIDLEEDPDAIGIAPTATYIAIVFSSLASLSSALFLFLRLIHGADVTTVVGLSVVFISLLLALFFFLYGVMALLTDYGQKIGLRD